MEVMGPFTAVKMSPGRGIRQAEGTIISVDRKKDDAEKIRNPAVKKSNKNEFRNQFEVRRPHVKRCWINTLSQCRRRFGCLSRKNSYHCTDLRG